MKSPNYLNNSVQEFFTGLSEPSLLSVTLALAICAIIFSSGLLIVNEQFFVSEKHRYFASDQFDFPVFVTSEAIQMSRTHGKKMMVITGASSTRVSVRKNKVAEIVGPSFSVFKLCTGRQSLWETTKLLDMIPDGTEGMVVIGLGPPRFTSGPETLMEIVESPRLALNSDAFDKELVLNGIKPRIKFGNYFLDNHRFFIVRFKYLLRNLLLGPPVPEYRYFDLDRLGEEKLEAISNKISNRLKSYEENYEYSQLILERILLRLQNRTSMKIVLLEHPVDPRFIEAYMGKNFYLEHRTRVRNFALTHEVSYLNANDVADFEEDDFYDWTHLRKLELTEQYTEKLTRILMKINDTTNRN